ncbi:hypothetical protein NEFER03_2062 [Nematocida sp. LUAm3]|nr:hypothetical protein NEFER03_2062 [Nematocida sp. LUAm3]
MLQDKTIKSMYPLITGIGIAFLLIGTGIIIYITKDRPKPKDCSTTQYSLYNPSQSDIYNSPQSDIYNSPQLSSQPNPKQIESDKNPQPEPQKLSQLDISSLSPLEKEQSDEQSIEQNDSHTLNQVENTSPMDTSSQSNSNSNRNSVAEEEDLHSNSSKDASNQSNGSENGMADEENYLLNAEIEGCSINIDKTQGKKKEPFNTHDEIQKNMQYRDFQSISKHLFSNDPASSLIHTFINTQAFIVHKDVSIVNKDVSIVHKDVSIVHKDVSIVHKDVSIVHKDVSIVHKDVSIVNKDLESINESKHTKEILQDRIKKMIKHYEKQIDSNSTQSTNTADELEKEKKASIEDNTPNPKLQNRIENGLVFLYLLAKGYGQHIQYEMGILEEILNCFLKDKKSIIESNSYILSNILAKSKQERANKNIKNTYAFIIKRMQSDTSFNLKSFIEKIVHNNHMFIPKDENIVVNSSTSPLQQSKKQNDSSTARTPSTTQPMHSAYSPIQIQLNEKEKKESKPVPNITNLQCIQILTSLFYTLKQNVKTPEQTSFSFKNRFILSSSHIDFIKNFDGTVLLLANPFAINMLADLWIKEISECLDEIEIDIIYKSTYSNIFRNITEQILYNTMLLKRMRRTNPLQVLYRAIQKGESYTDENTFIGLVNSRTKSCFCSIIQKDLKDLSKYIDSKSVVYPKLHYIFSVFISTTIKSPVKYDIMKLPSPFKSEDKKQLQQALQQELKQTFLPQDFYLFTSNIPISIKKSNIDLVLFFQQKPNFHQEVLITLNSIKRADENFYKRYTRLYSQKFISSALENKPQEQPSTS